MKYLREKIRHLEDALELCSLSKKEKRNDPRLQSLLERGLVKSFEDLYETSRKFLVRHLKQHQKHENVSVMKREDVFDLAREVGLVADVDRWMQYRELRNKSTHEYEDSDVDQVLEIAKEFLVDVHNLVNKVEQNDTT